MRHLIISREYPPAPYPMGGIGTYVRHVARLLAEAGEEVHVIAQRFAAAPEPTTTSVGGRLTVHRVPLDAPLEQLAPAARPEHRVALATLATTRVPALAFAWQAAALAEWLVEQVGIDLIEAQEWEAPLWVFQRRRALGLGPDRRPPCVVHLHSPTELIFRHNEWGTDRPDYLPLTRSEDYSIRHADALLCPSHFLAREAEAHYGLEPGTVEVIPLPVGDTPLLQRSAETWANGTVCYVGRLEPRKGVVEWVDAAVAVARERPDVRFELVGADVPYTGPLTVGAYAAHRIPPELRDRFRFVGALPRERLRDHLARARVAVVPSRWENFPNACIEAMASGLPVLATATGGMREMVADGRTGWIAPAARPAELAAALRRALDTPPDALARMGGAAAADIRRLCDNAVTVERQLAFRRRIAARGVAARPPAVTPAAAAEARGAAGIAVVARAGDDRAATLASLDSVAAQTRPPVVRLLVGTTTARADDLLAGAPDLAAAWTPVDRPGATGDAGWAAVAALRPPPLGVVFLEPGDLLAPEHLARCERALRGRPEVGLLAPWGDAAGGAAHVRQTLELPWLLLDDALAPGAVFRVAALQAAGGVRADVAGGLASLDAAAATLAAGWSGAVYPSPLASRRAPDALTSLRAHAERARGRRMLLERSRAALAHDGAELLVHLESALLSARGPRPFQPDAAGATDAAASAVSATGPASALSPALVPPGLEPTPGEQLRAILAAARHLASAAARRPGATVGWLARTTARVASRGARRTVRAVADRATGARAPLAPPAVATEPPLLTLVPPPRARPAAAGAAAASSARPSPADGAMARPDVPVARPVAVEGGPAANGRRPARPAAAPAAAPGSPDPAADVTPTEVG